MRLVRFGLFVTLATAACGGASVESGGSGGDRACRDIEAEDDGFGGVVRSVRIWDDLVGANGDGILELIEGPGGVRLGLGIGLAQIGGVVLPAGTTFEVRLSDDSILAFESTEAVEGAARMLGWGGATVAMVEFEISDDQLAQMAAADWAAMRVTPPGASAYSMPIDDGDSEQMRNAATCFQLARSAPPASDAQPPSIQHDEGVDA